MCFTPFISGALATIGFAGCAVQYKLKHKFINYMHLLFYSGMELLQTVQHMHLQECTSTNKFLTKLAYIYIWLQPIVYNLYYLHTNYRNKKIFIYNLYVSCAIFLLAMDRLFWHMIHTQPPRADEISSGPITCTLKGDSHIYWLFDLYTNHSLEPTYLLYMILICAPAFWVDKFAHAIFLNSSFVSGLYFSYKFTNNYNEALPTWCILSVPYLLVSYALKLLPN